MFLIDWHYPPVRQGYAIFKGIKESYHHEFRPCSIQLIYKCIFETTMKSVVFLKLVLAMHGVLAES